MYTFDIQSKIFSGVDDRSNRLLSQRILVQCVHELNLLCVLQKDISLCPENRSVGGSNV